MFEIIHSELDSFLLVYDVRNDDDHSHLYDVVYREKKKWKIVLAKITFVNNVHIYHLDLSMIFDHFSVVRIHAHCFDDVTDMMMNDDHDHDHPLKENPLDSQ